MRNELFFKLAYCRGELIVGHLALIVSLPAGIELSAAGGYGALRAAAAELIFSDVVGYELPVVAQNILVVFPVGSFVLRILFVIGRKKLIIGSLLFVIFGFAVFKSLVVIPECVEVFLERRVVFTQLTHGIYIVRNAGKPRHERGKQQNNCEDDRDCPPLSFRYHAVTLIFEILMIKYTIRNLLTQYEFARKIFTWRI